MAKPLTPAGKLINSFDTPLDYEETAPGTYKIKTVKAKTPSSLSFGTPSSGPVLTPNMIAAMMGNAPTGVNPLAPPSHVSKMLEAVSPLVGAPEAVLTKATKGPKVAAPSFLKTSELRAILLGDKDPFEAGWDNAKIQAIIEHESWRPREAEEAIKQGDIILFQNTGDAAQSFFDMPNAWKETVINEDLIKNHPMVIYTLEGASAKRKVVITKVTADFPGGMMSVPKGVQLRLPNDAVEARRFFGCEVAPTEVFNPSIAKPETVFYPVLPSFESRAFRTTFSRIFVDFAKRTFRECSKGVIPRRGEGIHVPRNVSLRKIRKMLQDRVSPEDIAKKAKVHVSTIESLLYRDDYRPQGTKARGLPVPFLDRMNARQLSPIDFRYEKALGIEIEALCPLHLGEDDNVALQKVLQQNHYADASMPIITAHLNSPAFLARYKVPPLPSFMRVCIDKSIKHSPNGEDSHGGAKGYWGIEFRILIKRNEMETRILRAIEYINKLKCKVNKTCGLHIHFDMRDKDEKHVMQLAEKMSRWLSMLRELLPLSRRANQYCAFEKPQKPHWAAVSIEPYAKHKTVEVRVHSSTVNHIKIIQWIRLIETIMEVNWVPPMAKCLDALKMLRLTEADMTYWRTRHQDLNRELYAGAPPVNPSYLGEYPQEDEG